MKEINIKRTVTDNVENVITRVTEALKKEGFGVLTRIDLDAKVKEKLGKEMNQVVILGACNPQLAFEAYQHNSDVSGLLPCNTVVRKVDDKSVSVEIAMPTALMEILNDADLVNLAREADLKLQNVLNTF